MPPATNADTSTASAHTDSAGRTLTAESTFETFKDAHDCAITRFTNRRFLRASDNLLRETARTETCATSEGMRAQFTLEELPTDSAGGVNARVVLQGNGEPVGLEYAASGVYLYQVLHRGCCGTEDLREYYDLRSGTLVFSTSAPPRWIPVGVNRRVFIAFADNYSAVALPEAERDTSVIGVLQVGDGLSPTARVIVRGTPGAEYHVRAVRLITDGQLTDEATLWERVRRHSMEVTVRVALSSPTGTGPDVVLEVPILDGRPDLSRASAAAAQLSMQ